MLYIKRQESNFILVNETREKETFKSKMFKSFILIAIFLSFNGCYACSTTFVDNCGSYQTKYGSIYSNGNVIQSLSVTSVAECCKACTSNSNCRAYNYLTSQCSLFAVVPSTTTKVELSASGYRKWSIRVIPISSNSGL